MQPPPRISLGGEGPEFNSWATVCQPLVSKLKHARAKVFTIVLTFSAWGAATAPAIMSLFQAGRRRKDQGQRLWPPSKPCFWEAPPSSFCLTGPPFCREGWDKPWFLVWTHCHPKQHTFSVITEERKNR